MIGECIRVSLILLCLFCLGCPSASRESTNANVAFVPSKMSVRESDVNDGVSVTLKNMGSQAVTIQRVTSSCGCTVTRKFAATILEPGKLLEIPLSVDLPEYGTKEVVVTAHIDSAISHNPDIRLRLEGGAPERPQLIRVPSSVTITGSIPGERATKNLWITTIEKTSQPWLQNLSSPDPTIQIKLLKVETERSLTEEWRMRRYGFDVSANVPDFETSHRNSSLEITLDSARARVDPRTTIPLIVSLQSPLRPVPSRLIVDREDGGTRDLLLISDGSTDWNIMCSTTDESIDVSAVTENAEDSRIHRFNVQVKKEFSIEAGNAELRFECISPSRKLDITVPVILK